MTQEKMDEALTKDFQNDLKAFDDKLLERERNAVQDEVDRETAWLEAIAAEQRIRARRKT